MDGELGYFEAQNEQHKAAQAQLFKANEYEYMQGKDASMKFQESEVAFNKLDQDEKSIGYEIDRLKQHSDQMLKDQADLQSEIDALDRHMANLNNQNYSLQKELEEFVHADDAVRMNLDRKMKVENIRSRVDEVIARSQVEVSRAGIAHREMVERPMRTFSHDFGGPMEAIPRRKVTSHSPIRHSPIRAEHVIERRHSPIRAEHHIIERRPPLRPMEGTENMDLRR